MLFWRLHFCLVLVVRRDTASPSPVAPWWRCAACPCLRCTPVGPGWCEVITHVRVFHGVETPRRGLSPRTMPERESLRKLGPRNTPWCFNLGTAALQVLPAHHSAARLLSSHIGSIGLGDSAGDALCARQPLGLPQAASAEEFTPGEQHGAIARACINRARLRSLGQCFCFS
jgi:hypothetical protein